MKKNIDDWILKSMGNVISSCTDSEIMGDEQYRNMQMEIIKARQGKDYIDGDYISCQENGIPHSTSAMNIALTKLCKEEQEEDFKNELLDIVIDTTEYFDSASETG